MPKFYSRRPERGSSLTFGVVGYSTRALVQAVTDLGHCALAMDAFRDQDTLEMAERVILIKDWPGEIVRAACDVAVDAWLLGGGIENHATIVDALSKKAPILGPSGAQLHQLRSLDFWASLSEVGIHWPTTTYTKPSDDLAEWLVKPVQGSGGLGIRRANIPLGGPLDRPLDKIEDHSCYWQQRIEGRTLGVNWVIDDRTCRLIGVTQSICKEDWPGPTEFIYRGSFGPIRLSEKQRTVLLGLGRRVRAAVPDFRGYLQADFIEDSRGHLWLLEFNPRWTAGMEILHESAIDAELTPLGEHLRAWGISTGDDARWDKPPTKLVAKAIYYAADEFELERDTRCSLHRFLKWQPSSTANVQWCVADLPEVTARAPMRFDDGSPILTMKCRMGCFV